MFCLQKSMGQPLRIITAAVVIAWLAMISMFAMAQPLAENDTPSHAYVSLHGLGSVGSDMETMSNVAVSLGWFLRGGIRQEWLGLFIECQRDFWMATDKDVEMKKGVLNLGVGAEVLMFNDRLKMSLAMGTSTLLFDATFDKSGTTGVYVDFHPTVFRWPLTQRLFFEFSPFGATVMIPAVAAPVLKRLEYRTTFGMELQF